MISFSDYLKSVLKPKYIAVQYDKDTSNKLRAWAVEAGFDLSVAYDQAKQRPEDFDFHTTIFFSTSTHDMTKDMSLSGAAEVTGFMLLGENHNIPVLKIESAAIDQLREYFAEVYGMKDAWPEFKPHVSVSYSKQLPDVTNLNLPKFTLHFDKLKIDDAT